MNIQPVQPTILQRLLALGWAGCIWILSLATVSPSLHENLHCADNCSTGNSAETEHSAEEAHSCAVTLFDQGATCLLTVDLPIYAAPLIERLPRTAIIQCRDKAPVRQNARSPPTVLFV